MANSPTVDCLELICVPISRVNDGLFLGQLKSHIFQFASNGSDVDYVHKCGSLRIHLSSSLFKIHRMFHMPIKAWIYTNVKESDSEIHFHPSTTSLELKENNTDPSSIDSSSKPSLVVRISPAHRARPRHELKRRHIPFSRNCLPYNFTWSLSTSFRNMCPP